MGLPAPRASLASSVRPRATSARGSCCSPPGLDYPPHRPAISTGAAPPAKAPQPGANPCRGPELPRFGPENATRSIHRQLLTPMKLPKAMTFGAPGGTELRKRVTLRISLSGSCSPGSEPFSRPFRARPCLRYGALPGFTACTLSSKGLCTMEGAKPSPFL